MPIELCNVSKAFGEKQVLQNLTLAFPDGRVSCLMAASGYGKTTLLRLLLGLEEPDSGEITGLSGRVLTPVFQEDRLCENLSAGANIRMVMPKGVGRERIAEALEALGIPEAMHTPVRLLSGGQRRRVALARALCAAGDCLLLDEPFQGLDRETRERAALYVRRETQGKTVIVVTHDEAEAVLLDAEIIRIDEPR